MDLSFLRTGKRGLDQGEKEGSIIPKERSSSKASLILGMMEAGCLYGGFLKGLESPWHQ